MKQVIKFCYRTRADGIVVLHEPGSFDQLAGLLEQPLPRQPNQQVREYATTQANTINLPRFAASRQRNVQQLFFPQRQNQL